jgi:hypothetical protein
MNFPDKYAEAGLSPGPDIIGLRQQTLSRLRAGLTFAKTISLTRTYYGLPADLGWFAEEFLTDDASFSLVSNQREAVVLAATALSDQIDEGDRTSMLAVAVGSAMGTRAPPLAGWLLPQAKSAIAQTAVADRIHGAVTPSKIRAPVAGKLADDIAALDDDIENHKALLTKLRAEAQTWVKTLATQTAEVVVPLAADLANAREENAMLWWLFSEWSRLLDRPYSTFSIHQASFLAGHELAGLVTSYVGPIAAPAMMRRMTRHASPAQNDVTLATVIDGFETTDLKQFPLMGPAATYPDIFLVHHAAQQAAAIGKGSWHDAFSGSAHFAVNAALDPAAVSVHTYLEKLLATFGDD